MRITSFLYVAIAVCTLTGLGCGKGPAEEALKAADEAIAAAQSEVEKYVPEQFRLLTEAADAAHADFDAGNYRSAQNQAKAILDRVEEVKGAAETRKGELTIVWSQMSTMIPQMMTALTGKVNEITASKKMPAGMTKEEFEAAKTEMSDLVKLWGDAQTAHQNGQIADAVDWAAQVGNRGEALLNRFGVPTTAAAQSATPPAAGGTP